ncbi:hypothetical protein LXL04_014991 [Taraxacum kok-saghyz]
MSGPPPTNPTPQPTDKIYGITNIKSYVPLTLDLDRLNYDAWKELFMTHCVGYKVFNHLEPPALQPDEPDWDNVDTVVKQWLYGTLSQSLLQNILKKDSTAADVWKAIEALFSENKESKAMELDDELRSISLANSSIMDYCTRIKNIADLLANIGSPVPERNLVIYAINGLSQKFAHVITTIRHQRPFPTFSEMHAMLTLEERSLLKEQNRMSTASQNDHSSSPTILNTEHQNRGQNSGRGSQNVGRGGGRRYRGGGRGGRSGGRNGGRGRSGNNGGPPFNSAAWGGFFAWPMSQPSQRGLLPHPTAPAQWTPTSGPSPWPNSAPSWTNFPPSEQPTTLPQAFSTMNLQDPGNQHWYMDIRATAHLNNDPGLFDQTHPPSM